LYVEGRALATAKAEVVPSANTTLAGTLTEGEPLAARDTEVQVEAVRYPVVLVV
jgi:hypothetical protein